MRGEVRLEQWGTQLTPKEQADLSRLDTGDALPPKLYPLLYGFIDASLPSPEGQDTPPGG